MSRIHIEPLRRAHDRERFDCGEPALDEFLRRHARQNQERRVSRTFVATQEGEARVIGFYTLASGAVATESLPDEERRRLPRYPVPVVQLARLAVDGSVGRQGVGKTLLLDAMHRTAHVAEHVGVFALEVRAKHAAAARFYRKYGFSSFPDEPLHLYLPVTTIQSIVG